MDLFASKNLVEKVEGDLESLNLRWHIHLCPQLLENNIIHGLIERIEGSLIKIRRDSIKVEIKGSTKGEDLLWRRGRREARYIRRCR